MGRVVGEQVMWLRVDRKLVVMCGVAECIGRVRMIPYWVVLLDNTTSPCMSISSMINTTYHYMSISSMLNTTSPCIMSISSMMNTTSPCMSTAVFLQ